MSSDPYAQLKASQRQAWGLFAPLEAVTTIPAAELVKHARVRAHQMVLDVGCGTGVVAVTAAHAAAKVSGLDLSPLLIELAKKNASLAAVEVDFREGDVEALPYGEASFDVVLSQFGHMFAPRAEVALAEMLRVLRPGGTIAFSTWPPEHFVGQMFALVGKHVPAPQGVSPPPQWGDTNVVRQRLGDTVTDVFFDRGVMTFPTLSPQHYRKAIEEAVGPVAKLVESLQGEPSKLAAFRSELNGLVSRYFEGNALRQQFLMTRATKR
jgi:SAM-dependent methyltransferase